MDKDIPQLILIRLPVCLADDFMKNAPRPILKNKKLRVEIGGSGVV
ncbi:MAG: hypothetical protein FWG63_00540 [Defluviitaleaceae bacterium]|nr:hypothetical protein [Defluviitaleaceae bacterium]